MHAAGKRIDRPAGRALMLLDADNVARGVTDDVAVLTQRLGAAIDVAQLERDDHIIVACDLRAALPAARGAEIALGRPARLLVGKGRDGADRALLLALRDEGDADDIARRYDRVVIASGDHAFAPLAYSLRNARLVVWVVSHADALSRDLRRAAHVVRFLDAPAVAA